MSHPSRGPTSLDEALAHDILAVAREVLSTFQLTPATGGTRLTWTARIP